ncbi:unnamed protein product [Mytilus edulis]|uniref:Uncharacterized protein n=1 Tax=Mytilus edulis TaxID=6550 RepID=A0A8S3QTW8_MYTED|nr:unnamed protein product [Mytilus edulis]
MAMKDAGYLVEADFCRIFRNWYRAQDEAGISCTQRHEFEQELRHWLLNGVRFDVFPLEGRYVKDIPVILFEGLLLHIDRRSQLYTLTGGSYTARSSVFYIHTSSARVYPVSPMLQSNNDDIETCRLQSEEDIRRLRNISMSHFICSIAVSSSSRDHLFDMPERKTTNPKRKRGTITSLNEPAKGSKGIRADRYKVDESKILPHVPGILLDDNLT